MLKLENVSLRNTKKFYSLYNINIDFFAGDKALLVGDKESGNWFVLRAIAQIDDFYRGKIFYNDKKLNIFNVKKMNFGYLPENPVFFEDKTMIENLIYPLTIRKIQKQEAIISAKNLLDKYDLTAFENKLIKDIDKNTKEKLAILRLMIRKPKLLLIDFSNNDNYEMLNDLIKSSEISLIACDETQITNIDHNKIVKMKFGSIED